MTRWLLSLLLLTLGAPALATWDLTQLMSELEHAPSGRARFVETKYLALLERPLVSSGEMSFTRPDRLEKRTLRPRPETVLLDHDQLTVVRDQRQLRIKLAEQPHALAFVDSLRGALRGDRLALERNYALHLAGQRENWTLTLLPSDPAISSIVQRITLGGQRNRIRSIEYLQADGDRAVIQIDPLSDR